MGNSFVQFVVTGTTDKSAEEILSKYDPQLLEEAALFMRNLFGDEIAVIIEDVTLVDAEDIA